MIPTNTASAAVRLVAEADHSPRAFLIDAEGIHDVDSTASDMLEELYAELAESGIQLFIARASYPLRDALRRLGIEETIGEEHFYPTISSAVAGFLGGSDSGRATSPR